MGKNKVNIYDVAKKAGVGIGTVSRVLNDSNKVREKTRKKVLKVMTELNYHPNKLAQNLASKKANAVAVILPTFIDHFFVEVLKGIQDALEAKGIELILHKVSYNKNMIEKILDIIHSRRVDGIIAVSLNISDNDYQKLLAADFPIVLADEKNSDFHSIYFNDQKGAEMAVNYLIKAGHQKIAFIGGKKDSVPTNKRLTGVKIALKAANLKLEDKLLKFGDFQIEAGFNSMQEILELPESEWPTAVFAASDNQAIGALQLMESRGLKAPNDIAVIGYDNIELAQYLKITTIAQPMYQLGQLSIEVLLKTINNELEVKFDQELEVKLLKRSTA